MPWDPTPLPAILDALESSEAAAASAAVDAELRFRSDVALALVTRSRYEPASARATYDGMLARFDPYGILKDKPALSNPITVGEDPVAREAAALGLSLEAYKRYVAMSKRVGLSVRDTAELMSMVQGSGIDTKALLDLWARVRATGIAMGSFVQICTEANRSGLHLSTVVDLVVDATRRGAAPESLPELMQTIEGAGAGEGRPAAPRRGRMA